jgi:hypothetical protein
LTSHRSHDGQPLSGDLDAALAKQGGGVESHGKSLSNSGAIPKLDPQDEGDGHDIIGPKA